MLRQSSLSVATQSITVFCICVIVLLDARLGCCQSPDEQQHGHIMERKLATVQEVMEGIARADFDLIKKKSQLLHLLSREAGWNVLATPTYLRMSEDFRATVGQLERSAEKENLDAVGLAYVKLSISCIECHRYARNEMHRVGMQADPLSPVPVFAGTLRENR